ncbi:endoglucanase, partial [Candidatus Magnetoovum chiemensis]
AYFIFPAFNAFAEYGAKSGDNERKKFWKQVCNDTLAILKQSLSGEMALPPDWMLINQKGNLVTDKDKGRDFGYEAIRVPLYLALL